MKCCFLDRLNFFCKVLMLIGLSCSIRAQAIQLHALYTASCQREVGIILNVRSRDLSLLTLQGKIINVQRYEVIYLASYSLDMAPIAEVSNPADMPMVEIKTMEQGDLKTLVKGWPVDFSKDKIAFLNLRGTEVMIERTSIWDVSFDSETKRLLFEQPSKTNYDFVHPYVFASCNGSGGNKVYPQQLLSNPIAIKREFDRLQAGYEKIERYESDQQFYPVPEVYSNETSLGLWMMSGARYGASQNRKNNFAPYLVDDKSEGPFGFQRQFKTGSGPLLQSVHEETQTQAYYRMKADYFHFSAMVDPNLLLVGTKYHWSADDMSASDMRAHETAMLEFGFDYQKFSFELYSGSVSMGARRDDYFSKSLVGLQRVGLRYQTAYWIFNIMGGSGNRDDFRISLLRANVEWTPNKNHHLIFSVIDRKMSFDGHADQDQSKPIFQQESKSLTFAFYGMMRFKKRYWAGALLAAENATIQQQNKVFPKVGALISLSF